MLRTPLHALHVELGARMAPFAGYDMPIHYRGRRAGRAPPHPSIGRAVRRLAYGPGAARGRESRQPSLRFLETLCPADLVNLAPGRQRYTQLLNDGGGIDRRSDGHPPSRRGRSVAAGRQRLAQGRRLRASFAHACPRAFRLTLLGEAALIALQGPLAAATLARLAPRREAGVDAVHERPSGAAGRVRDLRRPLRLHRRGRIRDFGARVSTPRRWPGLLLAEPEVAPIGLGARDFLRLEAGLCLYGHELDETVDPVEAGLAWSIQKRRRVEGGFPGVARIRERAGQRTGADSGSAFARTVGRPRARGRRSSRPRARRSASSPPAASVRAWARRSRWDLSAARTPRPGRRSASSCAARR